MPELLRALLIPLVCGLLVHFCLEALLQPTPQAVWKRSVASLCINTCTWVLCYCFELSLFQRPWFAAFLVCSLFALMVLISNTKHQTLREPFFFQDFEYFTDAIRHPRLYIPFFGIGRTIAGFLIFFLVLACGVYLETPLTRPYGWTHPIGLWSLLLILGLIGIRAALTKLPAVTFNPNEDLANLGFFPYLFAYWRAETLPIQSTPPAWWSSTLREGPKPDILVVQSESFVDLRTQIPTIRPDMLPNYDQFRREACAQGRLDVPAWGANTVRTEYAFLSGLSVEQLGVHRFNPYRKFARHHPYSLASWLKRQGYRTICIHPYPASFYRRAITYPLMGYDEFIDIAAFGPQDEDMPYISDRQVATKIEEVLRQKTDQPLFIFVITMENHGPLHLEKARPGEWAETLTQAPPQGCDDLVIYLRHQRNADKMLASLRHTFMQHAHPKLFCWYGDHVPIMEQVYKKMGMPDGRTDYFIWSDTQTSSRVEAERNADELASTLLAGIQQRAD